MTADGQRLGPLSDVRVIDLTRLLPGNYATLMLRALGAEVIKVEERRGGDGTRAAALTEGATESGGHVVLNRGKQSLAIDLKQPDGTAALLRLIAEADVLVDSFRPGVLDRLGLGADQLHAANPALVHVSITAYGHTGPNAALPAHDLNSEGIAGVLSQIDDSGGGPVMPGVQTADTAAGLHGVIAVLSGLRAVAQTGEFQRADVAMADSAATMLPLQVSEFVAYGQSPAKPNMLTGALASYRMYECADGHYVTVGGLEPKFFTRMVELMDRPELASQQYNLQEQDTLARTLADTFITRTRDEWVQLLFDQDTCVTPVLNVAEMLVDANFVERKVVTTARFRDGRQVPVVAAVPWQVTDDKDLVAPTLGEHDREVLTSAGLTDDEIDDLIARGIVGAAG